MGEVKFIQTTASKLNSINIIDGQVIALKDKPAWYYDTAEGRRSIDQSEFESRIAALESSAGSSSLIGETTSDNTSLGADCYIDAGANNSVAIGINEEAVGYGTTCIGSQSLAYGDKSISIGHEAIACLNNNALESRYAESIAIGNYVNADKSRSICIGQNSNSRENNSITIGHNSDSLGINSITIGVYANAVKGNCISIGTYSSSIKDDSISIGVSANCTSDNDVSIGTYSKCNGQYSISIGSSAKCAGSGSISIGMSANSIGGSGSISIGQSTSASGYATAVGFGSRATALNSASFGCRASTSNENSIQLGDNANLSSITSKVEITVTSDERDKIDIEPINYGALEFINQIEPITYKSNQRILYIDEENLSEEDQEIRNKYGICSYDKEAHKLGIKKGSRQRVGVSAQQVQEILKSVYGSDSYANLVNDNLFDRNESEIPECVESQLTVNYPRFVPFLIKSIQELTQRIEKLEKV